VKGGLVSHGKLGTGGARRLALLCAFILALLGQSIVTQAHVHVGAPDARTAVGRGGSAASGRAAGHHPGVCLICWEKAQAGSYLVPILAMVAAAGPALFAIGSSWLAGLPCRTHRHGWRSRAPPSLRQP
jgi:hypothetical protein